jgi:hypothetical protein
MTVLREHKAEADSDLHHLRQMEDTRREWQRACNA